MGWLRRWLLGHQSASIEITMRRDSDAEPWTPFVVVTSHLKLFGRYFTYAQTWWTPGRAVAFGQSCITAAGAAAARARAENGEVDDEPSF